MSGLFRIVPPRGYSHPYHGMTGTLLDAPEHGYYALSLRCRPDVGRVRVPRSWVVAVDPQPLSASEARERLAS